MICKPSQAGSNPGHRQHNDKRQALRADREVVELRNGQRMTNAKAQAMAGAAERRRIAEVYPTPAQ
jgi:hypothetical protein